MFGIKKMAGLSKSIIVNRAVKKNMENKIQKVVAVTLVRNIEGLVLVQKRIDLKTPEADGKWEFPGGVIEFGETPQEAAIRECKEETGCIVEIIRLLPFAHSRVWKRADGDIYQAFVWCFEARYVKGEIKPSDREVSEIKWVTKEEVRNLDVLPAIQEFINLID
jgi:mutator protein MutT